MLTYPRTASTRLKLTLARSASASRSDTACASSCISPCSRVHPLTGQLHRDRRRVAPGAVERDLAQVDRPLAKAQPDQRRPDRLNDLSLVVHPAPYLSNE